MSEEWLEALQEKVVKCWQWHSPALQIGFQCVKHDAGDDFWEIWAFPAVQEIVGGKEDGETVWSGFNFDVLQFLTDFEPEAIAISTRQPIHPTELTFEGRFRGRVFFCTFAWSRLKMPRRPKSLTSAVRAGRLYETRNELLLVAGAITGVDSPPLKDDDDQDAGEVE